MKKCVCGNEMSPKEWTHEWVCKRCGRKRPMESYMTNGDSIRDMNDDELAAWLFQIQKEIIMSAIAKLSFPFESVSDTLNWLQQPKEET